MLWTRTGTCEKDAAAVFAQGISAMSPQTNTFGNFGCCIVSLSDAQKPFAVAKGLLDINSGALCGGTICKKS